MKKTLIAVIDELIFRPIVWLVTWQPKSKRSNWDTYWTSEEL